jgi:hypothetical protein
MGSISLDFFFESFFRLSRGLVATLSFGVRAYLFFLKFSKLLKFVKHTFFSWEFEERIRTPD